MRVLIQRVKNAKVIINDKIHAEINKGMLIFVGVGKDDNMADIETMARKLLNLRIFNDEHGKMNLNVQQVKSEILSVPQFTLYADTRRGNRPGFDMAAEPGMAKEYWIRLNELLSKGGVVVKEGVFGAHMEVSLINDGPVTIWLDSRYK
jgi:D-tyrosyl-tRNA(Tyr) deacylase